MKEQFIGNHKPRGKRGETPLRIIGGRQRGRRLVYDGDPRTRPMKDRLRETVFNLVGPAIKGTHAVDLFAGTGAIGLEALSRGAIAATFLERRLPALRTIEQNVKSLGVEEQSRVLGVDTFVWGREPSLSAGDQEHCFFQQAAVPWTVFCSPPYDFYVERGDEMLTLLEGLLNAAPAESQFVVEADHRFDVQQLPQPSRWDVRTYRPAVLGILRP